MIESVGIVIPCLNEEKSIQACIESVFKSDYKGKLELVVCDGMSTDGTREIITSLTQKHDGLTLLDNKERHTPAGLNLGLKYLNTDVKIILGAHASIDKSFVANNVQTLIEQPEAGCVGGIINNIFENEISRIIGLAMSSPFGVGNARFRTGGEDGWVDTVAFGAYRKEVFEDIGYFDETLVRNQDDEFNYRMTSNGYKIYYNNKIRSNYHVRASFNKLYKQYNQYGYWKVYVNKKVKAITSIRQLFPAVFVGAVVCGAALSLVHFILFFSWIGGLLFYLIAAFLFAFQKTKKVKEIFMVMFSFMILHWSYGGGYLKGIFNFIVLGKKPSRTSKNLTR